MNQPDYIELINQKFSERKERNPRYSLRSFARQLGLDPGSLSGILRGRRPLSPLRAQQVISRLGLNDSERKKFYVSLLFKKKIPQDIIDSQERYHVDEEKYFNILSDWEYAATLCLASLRHFKLTAKDLAVVLKITLRRSSKVIADLKTTGLLMEDDMGYLRPVQKKFSTSEDTLSLALQHSHLSSLKIAKQKLESLDVKERDFSSLTLAVKSSEISKMKSMIRNFRAQFEAEFESESGDSVVQLNLQLFPISEKLIKGKKRMVEID